MQHKSKSSYIGPLSPEFALLGLLYQEPAHGYELHQRLVYDLGQVWHVSQSQTYNILNRLENQGYIQGVQKEQKKLPNRRQFHLTESGRGRFLEWLHSPAGSSVRAVRVEFITRLYFASNTETVSGDKIIDLQEEEIRVGLDRLRKVRDEVPAESVYNHLGLDLRIRQLESMLTWLEKCRVAIKTNSTKYEKNTSLTG